jgi:hypothetical protein
MVPGVVTGVALVSGPGMVTGEIMASDMPLLQRHQVCRAEPWPAMFGWLVACSPSRIMPIWTG